MTGTLTTPNVVYNRLPAAGGTSGSEETPDIVYGRLLEAAHISGYSFERACLQLEWLLESDRWKTAGCGCKHVGEFLDSIKFGDLRATAEQRKRIAQRIKELTDGEAGNRPIARLLGVGHQTIGRDVGPSGPPQARNLNGDKDDSAATGPNGPPLGENPNDIKPAPGTFAPHGINRVMLNTGDNEWYTPAKYVELARQVLGEIELDPASNDFAQQTIKAARYFTGETDGLNPEWHGRVWLNPPYAQPLIEDFINKLVAEYSAGRVIAAILLVNNCTDAAWFHSAAGVCAATCFTRGRIKFEKPDGVPGSPTQGQAFFYFGPSVSRFTEVFGAVGLIMLPSKLEAAE